MTIQNYISSISEVGACDASTLNCYAFSQGNDVRPTSTCQENY